MTDSHAVSELPRRVTLFVTHQLSEHVHGWFAAIPPGDSPVCKWLIEVLNETRFRAVCPTVCP